MTALDPLVDDFLAAEWGFHPIDASFAGAAGYDGELPPADAFAATRERAALTAIRERLGRDAPAGAAGDALDVKLMRAQIAHRLRMLDERPLHHNPAWATGEAAFSLISLLLRDGEATHDDLIRRVCALPDFLSDAATRMRGIAIPAGWAARARTEGGAIATLLDEVPSAAPRDRERARQALHAFIAALDGVPDCNAACGAEYFEFLMREVHGFDETPAELDSRAAAAFECGMEELAEHAARLDPGASWREQLASLVDIGPGAGAAIASYRHWNARALEDASALVTPAAEYTLVYRELPDWAARVSDALYFLSYRSPRALAPGTGSTYWVPAGGGDAESARRAHNTATVKLVHAVHHGSIGHHTQNARARSARSRLARIAGTDCAAAIAFLSAGTMVEGWACYAEDLLAEVPGFYTEAELLQLKYFEVRNIGCALADVRFHTRRWSLDEMRAFYRDVVGFAPQRIASETIRNSMFPASRIMYWTGVERIKAMRARSTLETKAFHDRLLSYGAAPLAWIAEEMEAGS